MNEPRFHWNKIKEKGITKDEFIHMHLMLEYACYRYLNFSLEKDEKKMYYFRNQIYSFTTAIGRLKPRSSFKYFLYELVPPYLLIMVNLIDSVRRVCKVNTMNDPDRESYVTRINNYLNFLLDDEDTTSEELHDLLRIFNRMVDPDRLASDLRKYNKELHLTLDAVIRVFLSSSSHPAIYNEYVTGDHNSLIELLYHVSRNMDCLLEGTNKNKKK
ncbi:hypothetical protein RF11_07584 [Thelohanellus kitauei]|uniref:Uncharacterized protein n=1 Tax=Thelohanellus kitauei TaxID=669202 RepID=A0A0C2M7R0_THEKT|nr:hypothetical protein RF11_07584 [Thelohanellus kitauei]